MKSANRPSAADLCRATELGAAQASDLIRDALGPHVIGVVTITILNDGRGHITGMTDPDVMSVQEALTAIQLLLYNALDHGQPVN